MLQSGKILQCCCARISFSEELLTQVLAWIKEDGTAANKQSFCDAGCGVGSLAIPLAEMGAKVGVNGISCRNVVSFFHLLPAYFSVLRGSDVSSFFFLFAL